MCKICNGEPELAFGVAIGGNRFLCRCEKTECPRYDDCSAADNFERIEREPDDAEPKTELPEQLTPETITQPEDIEPETITQPEAVEPEPPAQAEALTQDEVIYASPDSRIWVNAEPGSGKTYTVVKRLAYLLKNDVSEDAILVLCFSKNAVAVIRARLREEIGALVDGFIAEERLIIRTFDSFATYMLSDDLPPGLNYEQRIELFIEKLREQPDSLEDFSYLIVDELQDTVGVRARMLREMLSRMDCGALLLGDRCQSIYDWSVRDKGDCASADLFRWIEKQGFQTGKMERNHRQTKALDGLSAKMRQSLLHGDEEEQERVLDECKACLPTLKEKELPHILTRQNELILCKTNGEVAAISDLFFSGEFVPHTVMRGAGHQSLASWIGQILGGYTEIQIDKDTFAARAEESGVDGIDEKWETLKALDSHPHSAVLYRREALRSLSKLDAPPELCLNRPGAGVIVSTVHRAKGSEAERVYWLNSPLVFNNQADDPHAKTDALKASYVAVTRAKTDLRLVKPEQRYMKPVGENRWIKTGWSYSKKRPFCSGIAMEPDDLDYLSCASGEDAEEIQAVLSKSAESILKELQEGETEGIDSNPIQLRACPYCGKPLDPQNAYRVIGNAFRARCPSADCPFHDELPIVTVDDDIYKRRPTLLISTVDKFARLTWEKQSGALFATDGNGLPPSLLIQDELHLISGPLGSVSGLYEIAIENLCERQGVGPKIIAATATVRNASGQIRALYGREHFQFPPSGLDARNSFSPVRQNRTSARSGFM